jgi:hypothetical protein
VGVRECKIGWIHPMGLSVRLLRDPELTTWGKSCIVANESAGATDGEQRRRNERFPPRSERRYANGPMTSVEPIENFRLIQSGVPA